MVAADALPDHKITPDLVITQLGRNLTAMADCGWKVRMLEEIAGLLMQRHACRIFKPLNFM